MEIKKQTLTCQICNQGGKKMFLHDECKDCWHTHQHKSTQSL